MSGSWRDVQRYEQLATGALYAVLALAVGGVCASAWVWGAAWLDRSASAAYFAECTATPNLFAMEDGSSVTAWIDGATEDAERIERTCGFRPELSVLGSADRVVASARMLENGRWTYASPPLAPWIFRSAALPTVHFVRRNDEVRLAVETPLPQSAFRAVLVLPNVPSAYRLRASRGKMGFEADWLEGAQAILGTAGATASPPIDNELSVALVGFDLPWYNEQGERLRGQVRVRPTAGWVARRLWVWSVGFAGSAALLAAGLWWWFRRRARDYGRAELQDRARRIGGHEAGTGLITLDDEDRVSSFTPGAQALVATNLQEGQAISDVFPGITAGNLSPSDRVRVADFRVSDTQSVDLEWRAAADAGPLCSTEIYLDSTVQQGRADADFASAKHRSVSKEPLVHTRGARLYAAGAIMHAAGEFGGVVFDYRPTREGIVVFAFGNGPARHPEWSSHRHLLYAAGSVAAVRGAVHQYQPVHAADGPPTELVSASHLLGVGSGGGVPGIVVVLRGNELEYACDEGYALFIIDGTTPTTRLAVGVSTGPLAVPLHGRGLAVLARAEVAAALEGWLSKEALNSAFARGAEANFALAALDDLRARVPAHDGAVVCLAFQTHEGALQPRILRLSCSADQSSVLVVTDAVVRFARELGVDHPDLVVMREALDEALANSVEHGSGMDSSQLIHVSVRSPANDDAAEGSIAVTIGDSRTQIASPGFPTHPKRIRGMGGAGEGRIAELTAGLGGSYHRQASTSTLTFFSSLSIEESSEDE